MKVEYVNPFITSTIATFGTMVQAKVLPGKPTIKAMPFPTYDISGIIGVSGDAQGSIALSFPKATALRAVSQFLSSEVKIVGPDLTDAIGEMTNIIAGSAKKDLEGLNVSISLPNVIIGQNHHIAAPKEAQSFMVPFSSEMGGFALEVALKTP